MRWLSPPLPRPLERTTFHSLQATCAQTGSGKTYTVAGDTQRFDQRGIIPRSLNYLFSEIDLREDREVTVKCSYLEIYNEVPRSPLLL